MRRGPRSHNSRVDSERRGEGRTITPAPFSILGYVSRHGLERIGISVGIARLVTVQALEILFDQDGQVLARFERLVA